MCGRYQLPEEPDALLQRVLDDLNRAPVKASGEIFPADRAPVLAPSRSGRAKGFAMRWGFTLNGRRVINARSETAAERPLFRDSLLSRRCLIPLTRYYEWHRAGNHAKYAVTPKESAWIAGLYRLTSGEPEFTVLTRAPGEEIAWLHDRMPVLLPKRVWDDWLTPSGEWRTALDSAVTRVAFEAVGDVQLGMKFESFQEEIPL